MLIFMLETRRGCEDGFTVRRFHKDYHYDITATLAHAFIRAGWAVKANPAVTIS